MSAADKLAQVLAEHAPVIRVDRIGSPSGCQCMDRVFYKTETWHDHLAAVVLAHLTAEGWAKGREEWGFTLERLHTRVSRTVSKEAAEEIARVNEAHDPKVYHRRVTDWEPVDA